MGGVRKRSEGITPEDVWSFIQEHKGKTKEEFGTWMLGQHYRLTSKIVKAIVHWNGLEEEDEA